MLAQPPRDWPPIKSLLVSKSIPETLKVASANPGSLISAAKACVSWTLGPKISFPCHLQ